MVHQRLTHPWPGLITQQTADVQKDSDRDPGAHEVARPIVKSVLGDYSSLVTQLLQLGDLLHTWSWMADLSMFFSHELDVLMTRINTTIIYPDHCPFFLLPRLMS